MTLFEQLEGLMAADAIIQEVTRPQEDKSVQKLILSCGVLIQANILVNKVNINYENGCLVVKNPIKSKIIR